MVFIRAAEAEDIPSLQVGIGRYKKMSLNNDPVYSVLTVGDQLLWGAAEPLRRMLNILLGKI